MKDVFVLCMQSGRTLLHFAAQLDHREAVECLLEKKADADAKDMVSNITNSLTHKGELQQKYNLRVLARDFCERGGMGGSTTPEHTHWSLSQLR